MISKIESEHPGVYPAQDIAHSLSFLAGAVLFLLGILRLGWLIEFIPYVPISAFVTSASITIISTQLPTLLGISGINTRESPYRVYTSILKNLHRSKQDAAIGCTSIMLLWSIKTACATMEQRQPHRKRAWSLIASLRLTVTISLYTLISWLVHRTAPPGGRETFRIVGKIEKGFSHAGVLSMDPNLLRLVAAELPAIVVILIVEHIAIAKSFGRRGNYTIIPSQEMIAQGAANLLSPFVGGYVCTGSFGASAVLSKAAVRTPLAGLFSGMVLVLALYALTGVFYYIPNAALAGLILHCTVNLITPPKSLYRYWRLSPVELLIWVSGVAVAFFTTLETAIYLSVGLSFALLLIRMAKSPAKFRGSVTVLRIPAAASTIQRSPSPGPGTPITSQFAQGHPSLLTRNVYLPYDTQDNHNPKINVEPAYPGVFIYRFSENFNYINQAVHIDHLTTYIKAHTRRTTFDDSLRRSDYLWCEAPPTKARLDQTSSMPILRAVVLDLSTVNIIDITSVNGLTDLRSTLDRYAAPAVVEWHFAGVHNRWTRRALAFAGFGTPMLDPDSGAETWCPTYTVAISRPRAAEAAQPNATVLAYRAGTEKHDGDQDKSISSAEKGIYQPVYGVNRPFFHIDLHDAVDAAVRHAQKQDERDTLLSRTTTDRMTAVGGPDALT